ncbi:uracil-DNA glycosylase family protein [Prevotella intermedia]|uniref:DNA glycosylase n=1 Tax=Prevotella intermedia TaxID=28131 RepID=A0A2M8TLG4_PREIN|nr:uracil-DNA glycosylase family protein [Prevotella intermedia]MCK6144648.1 uracil-DNA glycosylase family protein [Prevotella intermedia]OWP32864.1 DNA glycosylase [Prevotella intermedia]PJI24774.1 DNA glycosylase [Prevotella intermedia]
MEIETHPFEPWLPVNAKLLMLGTFPPAPKRWAMEWYYPNFTNDMWRIFGLIFFGDKLHFVDEENKTYRLNELKQFLKEKGVALFDTALRIRRTTGTASDKDLEIVEPADLDGMLRSLPECKAVLAAGQLATKVFTEHYNIDARNLKMGEYRTFDFEGRTLKLYRQPSSSRAYPMKVEKKAVYYEQMFKEIQII